MMANVMMIMLITMMSLLMVVSGSHGDDGDDDGKCDMGCVTARERVPPPPQVEAHPRPDEVTLDDSGVGLVGDRLVIRHGSLVWYESLISFGWPPHPLLSAWSIPGLGLMVISYILM